MVSEDIARYAASRRSEGPPDVAIGALQEEVQRLTALVGANEESYLQLKLDLLEARDRAIGAEAEVARLHREMGLVEVWHEKADELDRVYRSNTWRLGWVMTAPIRFARRVARKLR